MASPRPLRVLHYVLSQKDRTSNAIRLIWSVAASLTVIVASLGVLVSAVVLVVGLAPVHTTLGCAAAGSAALGLRAARRRRPAR